MQRLPTADLTPAQISELRALLWAAFEHDEHGGFTEDDWQHSVGGLHFLLDLDGTIVTHASVVERELHVDGRPLRTGYVEAVATAPAHQGRGYGSAVMHAVNEYVRENFELGALGTGSQAFYERLGWQIWRGPSSVRTSAGTRATPDEDGFILVLLWPGSPPVDTAASITCEWREGDVW